MTLLLLAGKTFLLSLTLAILLNSEISIAQPSSDYFVTNRGDTVAAEIKSKKWDLTPQKIVASVSGSKKSSDRLIFVLLQQETEHLSALT